MQIPHTETKKRYWAYGLSRFTLFLNLLGTVYNTAATFKEIYCLISQSLRVKGMMRSSRTMCVNTGNTFYADDPTLNPTTLATYQSGGKNEQETVSRNVLMCLPPVPAASADPMNELCFIHPVMLHTEEENENSPQLLCL